MATGETTAFALTVTNNGTSTGSNSRVTVTLSGGLAVTATPAGCTATAYGLSCIIGTLASGATASFAFGARATEAGGLIATANASADGWDYEPANDSVVFQVTAASTTRVVPALPGWASALLACTLSGIALARSRPPQKR